MNSTGKPLDENLIVAQVKELWKLRCQREALQLREKQIRAQLTETLKIDYWYNFGDIQAIIIPARPTERVSVRDLREEFPDLDLSGVIKVGERQLRLRLLRDNMCARKWAKENMAVG